MNKKEVSEIKKQFAVKHAVVDAISMTYTKTLPVKQKPVSYLGIGDKDWLYCTTEYRIELKKPLTREYAEEVARQFSK